MKFVIYQETSHIIITCSRLATKASHTGSYDFWIVRMVAIVPRCERSAMFATISSSARIRQLISTRGRAITNNMKISMARAIVGNRATSGSDQRPMYDQLLRPTTDRTINRCILRPIVRALVVWPSARSVVAPDGRS